MKGGCDHVFRNGYRYFLSAGQGTSTRAPTTGRDGCPVAEGCPAEAGQDTRPPMAPCPVAYYQALPTGCEPGIPNTLAEAGVCLQDIGPRGRLASVQNKQRGGGRRAGGGMRVLRRSWHSTTQRVIFSSRGAHTGGR